MYTLVFMANRNEKLTLEYLRHCARITRQWMPTLHIELKDNVTLLPEKTCGWFWLHPAISPLPLISECLNDQYAVLAFGEMVESGPHSVAHRIFEAWESGGPKKVRELEGCFSSIILNRINGSVELLGDVMGRRALSYFTDGEVLIASPHDVALVSSGRIPVEFDETSLGSVAAVEWSLGGKSLLRNVRTCHPAEFLRWSEGEIHHLMDPVLDKRNRIQKENSNAVMAHLDQMMEQAQSYARSFVTNKADIHCDLSAGLDSRVVLSLLLSVINDPSRIIATSVGEENNLDVRIARQLGKMFGTRFFSYVDAPPSPDGFVSRCDLLAFAMNGGTPGKRAIKYPTEYIPNPQAKACGNGGEIFRGNYYLNHPMAKRKNLQVEDAFDILRKRTRLNKLPWGSPDLAATVKDRLRDLVYKYAAISRNGFDILDLYYLYERMGVWGASTARQTWKHPRWSPFMSPQLVRMAYRMPAPIAHHATIHVESLRRFAPKAYWIRVNGNFLALEGEGILKSTLKKMDKFYLRVQSHLQRRFHPVEDASGRKDMDQLAEDVLAGALFGIVRDILTSEGSFAMELFGRCGVESLLKEHASKTHNHLEVLGLLVTMERWRTMVHGIAREAQAV